MEYFQTNKKSRLSNPDYHEARRKEIDDKIARKKEALQQPDQFSNTKSISRSGIYCNKY
ncbi:hypothetical protein DPMN_103868 [Dreissena polymorpha]|uniref:Uncharacterized protein n=1 Tax=Dreissena polymorpha TaxID=45954 RepID=A0A9D4HAW1_DREPO|nr:hypothetical protein DPMN_103868 [Dreissena polymorpha]